MRESILATLAYYDALDKPLSKQEIMTFLIRLAYRDVEYNKNIVSRDIDQLLLENKISNRDGFYYLFDREYLVPLRKREKKLLKGR